MNRRSITLVWMPSRSTKWSVFSIPDLLVCCLVFALLASVLMVAVGLHLGIKLHRDYLQLKEENTYLSQKKMELDSLGVAMKRIQGYDADVTQPPHRFGCRQAASRKSDLRERHDHEYAHIGTETKQCFVGENPLARHGR